MVYRTDEEQVRHGLRQRKHIQLPVIAEQGKQNRLKTHP